MSSSMSVATPNTGGSPGGRAGDVRRCFGARCGTITRADLQFVLFAAMLCSASYCLAIWHSKRGAVDSSAFGFSVVVETNCQGDAGADDEPLDFETHHSAVRAGLSVSSAAATPTPPAAPRRALTVHRDAIPGPASRSVARARDSARGPGRWAPSADGHRLRSTDAGAVLS